MKKRFRKITGLFMTAVLMLSLAAAPASVHAAPQETLPEPDNYVTLGPDNLTALRKPSVNKNPLLNAVSPGVINPSQFDAIKNVVVLIRFSGEAEFATANRMNTLENVYNTGEYSLKKYISDHSYGEMDATSVFFPKSSDGKTTVSYQDPHPIGYYKLKSTTNTVGYTTDTERFKREDELIRGALAATKAQIEATFTGAQLDNNNDRYVDSVCFIVNASTGTDGGINWNDLLWPHKYGNYGKAITLCGKYVVDYNLICAEKEDGGVMAAKAENAESGVITHEFLHTLGLPDLYYYNASGAPVGVWDVMGATDYVKPQNLTQYYQREFMGWGTPIDEIKRSGTYTLTYPKFNSAAEDGGETGGPETALIIRSPYSTKEYFVLEFRKKTGYDSSISGSGLIVYRINDGVSAFDGNADGPPDQMFVFRPYSKDTTANYYSEYAYFSSESGRTSIGKAKGAETPGFDAKTLYFSDGTNSGIVIDQIGSSAGDSITFRVSLDPSSEDKNNDLSFEKLSVVRSDQNGKLTFTADVANTTDLSKYSYYLLKDGRVWLKAVNVLSDSLSYTVMDNEGTYVLIAYCMDGGQTVSKQIHFDAVQKT